MKCVLKPYMRKICCYWKLDRRITDSNKIKGELKRIRMPVAYASIISFSNFINLNIFPMIIDDT